MTNGLTSQKNSGNGKSCSQCHCMYRTLHFDLWRVQLCVHDAYDGSLNNFSSFIAWHIQQCKFYKNIFIISLYFLNYAIKSKLNLEWKILHISHTKEDSDLIPCKIYDYYGIFYHILLICTPSLNHPYYIYISFFKKIDKDFWLRDHITLCKL